VFRIIADHAAPKEKPMTVWSVEYLHRPAAGKPLPWQSESVTHRLAQEKAGETGSQIIG